MMEIPDPRVYTSAFADALQKRLSALVWAPENPLALERTDPVDLNSRACVFAAGRILPRGAAPEFPYRRVLARDRLALHAGLCPQHRVSGSCALEFDNYGNLMLCAAAQPAPAQHAIYFLRRVSCIESPIAELIALALRPLMQDIGEPQERRREACKHCAGAGDFAEYPSSLPAGSAACLFAQHPDDLAVWQREGAVALCKFLDERFQEMLGPIYAALDAFQEKYSLRKELEEHKTQLQAAADREKDQSRKLADKERQLKKVSEKSSQLARRFAELSPELKNASERNRALERKLADAESKMKTMSQENKRMLLRMIASERERRKTQPSSLREALMMIRNLCQQAENLGGAEAEEPECWDDSEAEEPESEDDESASVRGIGKEDDSDDAI